MEKINERIRNLRRASGKSQTEIAECSGMSRTGYASIEQGVTIKTFEKLPAIAKALGCRIDDLFPEMDESPAPDGGKPVSADGFEDDSLDTLAL